MRKAIAIAALVFAVSAGRAAADPIADATPSHNDIIGVLDGWSGANLYLVGGPADIRVDILGYEAGWINTFDFGGGVVEYETGGGFQLFNNPLTRPSFQFLSVAPGLLNFTFATIQPLNEAGSVVNGENVLPDLLGTPNFFLSFNTVGTPLGSANPMSGDFVILAFDDGGAGPDDNHDDLVVSLRITGGTGTFSVPEGGSTLTLALVGLGLVGLGAMRRKYAL